MLISHIESVLIIITVGKFCIDGQVAIKEINTTIHAQSYGFNRYRGFTHKGFNGKILCYGKRAAYFNEFIELRLDPVGLCPLLKLSTGFKSILIFWFSIANIFIFLSSSVENL